jgi:ferredoxin
MSLLHIELGNCVKVFSKSSECTKCADICPENSISYIDNIPNIAQNCTDCGLCIGVCPTEATSIKDQDPLEFAFKFLEDENDQLTCGENIPCNGILNVEHIISLALLNKAEILNLSCCKQCLEVTKQNLHEANFFIDKIQSKKIVKILKKEDKQSIKTEEPNRRNFLKRLSIKGALKSKLEFDKEVEKLENRVLSSYDSANIRQKSLPNKRKFLYMALKRVNKLTSYKDIEEQELSFISNKQIDDSCDNCSICYRVCPTGALQSDKRNTKIEFDPLSCVKCHLCHDVCERDSIIKTLFNTKDIFEPNIKKLINFNIISCNDCGNFFTYYGGEPTCKRCKLEEEEAKDLWGIH